MNAFKPWLVSFGGACLLTVQLARAAQPVQEALPMVGTGGHGHTYPGATVPFGFVQLSPDTRSEGWDGSSGYHYSDTSILGFSHTHLSGTGAAALGDLLVLPIVGALQGQSNYVALEAKRFRSDFSHERELAQPGYYRVFLETPKVLAELTASAHAAMHRYTFPASKQSHLLIDLVHGINNRPSKASLKLESTNVLTGVRFSDGWKHRGRPLFFVIESSVSFGGVGLEQDGKPLPEGQAVAQGKSLRAHLDFDTAEGQQIVLRVGISAVSLEGARNNLRAELPSWDFDLACRAAQNAWNEQLGRIEFDCSNLNTRQTFYSAFYHTMTAPTLYNDADGSYLGADHKVHPQARFQNYSTFSLWDTFRAQHPLLTLTAPERVNDFVQSLLAEYRESTNHLLPLWTLANFDTGCMIGYHAIPVIYDAYQKGFRGFDVELAYQAMRETALSGRNQQDEYQKLGYVPWAPPSSGKGGATARTLEYAYDDWCIAQMARALGKTNDAALFTKRAQNYRHVWDPKTRFFRSPKADGSWQEPFDPNEVAAKSDVASGYYVEADAWQYSFAVQHDVPGMMELYGGKEAFISRLNELFSVDSEMSNWRIDVTGLMGQYAHGNEPCHHIAYLYALAGAPYKTAERVRQIQLTQYDNSPEGLCGNDDCGQISAWYVWSALGLYPVNPADGVYVIGNPLAQKAVLHLDPKFYQGGTFTILVRSNSKYAPASKNDNYIQSARLNGQPLNRPWLTQEEIVRGGTLELEMGILPNRAWGTGK